MIARFVIISITEISGRQLQVTRKNNEVSKNILKTGRAVKTFFRELSVKYSF